MPKASLLQRKIVIWAHNRMSADIPIRPSSSCHSASKRRRWSANDSESDLLFPKPFIFQGLQRRQPARRFFGRLRLWFAIVRQAVCHFHDGDDCLPSLPQLSGHRMRRYLSSVPRALSSSHCTPYLAVCCRFTVSPRRPFHPSIHRWAFHGYGRFCERLSRRAAKPARRPMWDVMVSFSYLFFSWALLQY